MGEVSQFLYYDFSGPRMIAEAAHSVLKDDTSMRILDIASGTGILLEEVIKKQNSATPNTGSLYQ